VAVTDVNRNASFSGCAFTCVARGKSSEVEAPRRGKARQGKAGALWIFERRLQRSIASFDTCWFPSRKRARETYALLRKKKKERKRRKKEEKEKKKVPGKCRVRVPTIYRTGVRIHSAIV